MSIKDSREIKTSYSEMGNFYLLFMCKLFIIKKEE